MKSLKAIVVLAVLLGLGVIVVNGIAYAQSNTIDQSGNAAITFINGIPDYQEFTGAPAATASTPTYADGADSGQSIIFNNGVPTTVIGADGSQTPYSASMFDFVSGYNADGLYGVGISFNSDVPMGGTWKQVTESGTFGTQEPNLSLS